VRAAAPVGMFAAGQAAGLVAVVWVGAAGGWGVPRILQLWDAGRLLAIARAGYGQPSADGVDLHAFFPGVPLAVRAVHALTGLGFLASAVTVSAVAGVALACGLDRLTTQLIGPGPAARRCAVFLAGALPLSVVLVMPYTEAPFCALTVWTLVFLGEARWLAAGTGACACGLVRPTAVALVAAVAVGAAASWYAGHPDRVRALVACAVAPLGALAYLGWAAATTGHLDAWSRAEANGWGARIDPAALASWLPWAVREGLGPIEISVMAGMVTLALTVGALVLVRAPGHVVAYVTTFLALVAGTDGVWNSKFRIMMPALLITCVLAAGALCRLRTPARAGVLTTVAALGCWFSTFAILVYPHAI